MNKNTVIKMVKTPPVRKAGERSFLINIDITDKLFTQPLLEGKLVIKEEDLDVLGELEFELKLLKTRDK